MGVGPINQSASSFNPRAPALTNAHTHTLTRWLMGMPSLSSRFVSGVTMKLALLPFSDEMTASQRVSRFSICKSRRRLKEGKNVLDQDGGQQSKQPSRSKWFVPWPWNWNCFQQAQTGCCGPTSSPRTTTGEIRTLSALVSKLRGGILNSVFYHAA